MVIIKKFKNYKKVKGGYNETSIKDDNSWNNINRTKIYLYEKKPPKNFYDNFLITDEEGYILDENGNILNDVISNSPLNLSSAFLHDGVLFNSYYLNKNITETSKSRINHANPLTRKPFLKVDEDKLKKISLITFDEEKYYRGNIYRTV